MKVHPPFLLLSLIAAALTANVMGADSAAADPAFAPPAALTAAAAADGQAFLAWNRGPEDDLAGYREFMKQVLGEQLAYGINGFHLDMMDQGFGPPYGCWCDTCRKEFQAQYGRPMPKGVTWDEDWDRMLEFRYASSDQFEKEMTNHVRRVNPRTTVDFNYHGNPPFSREVGQLPVRHAQNGDFVTGETGVWSFSALTVGLNVGFYRAATPGKPVQVAMQRGVRMYHDQTTRPLNDMRWELFNLLAHGAFVTTVEKTGSDGWLDPVAYGRFVGKPDSTDNWVRFPSAPSAALNAQLAPAGRTDWPFQVCGPAAVLAPTTAIALGELMKPHRTKLHERKRYNEDWPLDADAPAGPAILLNQVDKGKVLTVAASPGWATASEHLIVEALELRGTTVIPHVQSTEMRYRREPDRSLGARVQLFLVNQGPTAIQINSETPVRLRGKTPDELLVADDWAWHDFPGAWTNAPLELPPGALTVWSFNGKRAPWGAGTTANIALAGVTNPFAIAAPTAWLSAVTFLGDVANPFPDSVIFHIANRTGAALRLEACRLWLPADNCSWRAMLPQPWTTNFLAFPADHVIPAGDNGGARVISGRLPLSYAALEVRLAAADGRSVTLWAHLRIKREAFDISGGWVNSSVSGRSTLTFGPFLKTLRRMHINTAHIADTPGYTDTQLYERYPLKYFNKLEPVAHYDTDALLPRIHAVEFLGEPQYGGGRPVPPMTVWRALAPYQSTRLPTSVTHSEERIWRDYAGLSDFPHYDAYRVSAPAADAWSKYDRWEGKRIRWGAPLETIGDLTRSLRELNRPAPIAYWSQGAHEGWEVYGGRQRTSPTPDELRAQAYQALANRITSLYWFNLSLKSLLTFPDLIEPITRVSREIRMLDDFYLEGEAFSYQRVRRDGNPDWDLSVVAGPRGALLFGLDLDYKPDPVEKVFQFGPPREVLFGFRLPAYVGKPVEVFRVDADGTVAVQPTFTNGWLEIRDRVSRVAVYVAAARPGERERIEARRQTLIAGEDSLGFDPGRNPADLEVLKRFLTSATK